MNDVLHAMWVSYFLFRVGKERENDMAWQIFPSDSSFLREVSPYLA